MHHKIGSTDIEVGDSVLCRQNQRWKSTPAYSPKPYKVTKVEDVAITATREDKHITRHVSFFKKMEEVSIDEWFQQRKGTKTKVSRMDPYPGFERRGMERVRRDIGKPTEEAAVSRAEQSTVQEENGEAV